MRYHHAERMHPCRDQQDVARQTGTLANLLAQPWRSAAGLLERALIFQYRMSKTQQASINSPGNINRDSSLLLRL
jgi:hypothetical protein